MKVTGNKYFLLSIAIVAIAGACTKSQLSVENRSSTEISFRAEESKVPADTKSMLEPTTFQTAGTTLAVWDVYTDSQGVDSDWISSAFVQSQGPSSSIWPFTNDEHYYWSKTGSHKFFGYLTYDAAYNGGTGMSIANAYPQGGYSFNIQDKSLSISEHETPLGYQWDFLFSKPYVRDLDVQQDYSPVPLTLSHLYSAFALCLKNDSPGQVQIDTIQIEGLRNKASVVIDFTGSPNAGRWDDGIYEFSTGGCVTYTYAQNSYLTFDEIGSHIVPGTQDSPRYIDLCPTPGATGNPFNDSPDVIKDYHMIWPQDSTTLSGAYLTLGYTLTEDKSYDKYSAHTPNRNTGRGKYIVDYAEAHTGGCYNRVVNGTLGSGNYTYSGDYYVWAGPGQGSYDVTFRQGVASSTVCGYDFIEHINQTETKRMPTKHIQLQTSMVTSWEPGCKYLYLISHVSNELELDVKVLKWEAVHDLNVTFGTVFDDNPGLKDQIGL